MHDYLVIFFFLFDLVFAPIVLGYFFYMFYCGMSRKRSERHRKRYARAYAHAKKHGYPITEITSVVAGDFEDGYVTGQTFSHRF